jgi:hypothetical protein
MTLLEPTLRRWITLWTNLLTAFALIGLTLMLLVQKDGWMIPPLMFVVLIFHTVVTIYDLQHQGIEYRQRLAFR